MALVQWLSGNDPWTKLDRWQRELDRLSTVFRAAPSPWTFAKSGLYPALNIYDDGECLIVRGEVPGIDPKSIEVTVTGDTLTLQGERFEERAPQGAAYHRRERQAGRFQRAVSLPVAIDSTKVVASCHDGILEVRLPRAEQAKQHKIQVRAS